MNVVMEHWHELGLVLLTAFSDCVHFIAIAIEGEWELQVIKFDDQIVLIGFEIYLIKLAVLWIRKLLPTRRYSLRVN